MTNTTSKATRAQDGYSVVELVTVVAVVAILSAMAIPQLIGQRRLIRSNTMVRQMAAQLRYARQLAMSQRQAFTFVYDDATKQISIIDHNAAGASVLSGTGFPNTSGSSVVSAMPLNIGGLSSTELSYGIPTSLPVAAQGALGDGISKTTLVSNKFTVTFQPDGTVIDSSGNPTGRALFIYNNQKDSATASAISVVGASGRVKIWRYSAGASSYTE